MTLPLITFDLDGTLVDSLPATFQAMDAALSRFLGRQLEIADLRSHIKNTDIKVIEVLAGDTNKKEALELYIDNLEKKSAGIHIFEGLLEIITKIKNPKAIITNRARITTDIICHKTGLDQLFRIIVAADDGQAPKPSPEGIIHAAKCLDTRAQGGIMIGDGPDDIISGREAQMTTVAARWSQLIPIEQLEKQNPDIWVEKTVDLYPILGLKN